MKIVDLQKLSGIVEILKKEGNRIVQCHGVFDLLHIGHIRYFEGAAAMGDILIVTITPDQFVDKGPFRPAFTESLRAEAIASLKIVDYVAVNQWNTAVKTIHFLKPDVFVKGSEFRNIKSDKTGKIQQEKEAVDSVGATLAFTDDVVFSSTHLINRHLSNLPEEIEEYISLFRTRHTLSELEDLLDAMQHLKVVVIGDTIIDEYHYCEAMGKSTKDPVLAVRGLSMDRFAGGVLAVANHVAGLLAEVSIVTVLGEKNDHQAFIESQLKPGVSLFAHKQKNAPTIVKRRYVDGYSFNKLFEVYEMDDNGLCEQEEVRLNGLLKETLHSADVVIIADYGHGAISKNTVSVLCDNDCFLAVNAQANAGNRGFNTVTKYHRADYICIAEHELRLEMRDRKGPVLPMMKTLAEKARTSFFTVTRGRSGSIVLDQSGRYVTVPAFTTTVVDRVGAGDTVLSLTSLAAKLGADSEMIGFFGSVSGALAVGSIGNKKAVDYQSVHKFITALLK